MFVHVAEIANEEVLRWNKVIVMTKKMDAETKKTTTQ